MSLSAFRELARNFGALTGLDNPLQLAEGGVVELNGVQFCFSYNQNIDPNTFTIYCDFGPAPEDRKTEVYEALLEANMSATVGHSPAFMIFQPTKHVLFATHRSVNTSAEALCEVLLNVAEQARGWTQHYFQTAVSSYPHARVRQ